MGFADLKNDFVFRRIFATHPKILCRLLNDLLERSGEHEIESVEYLPSEQLPLVVGAKLSILDVRCRDRSGTTFVVEMQLIHVPGFINRVAYNACRAYSGQLEAGEPYTKLADVMAISICDFELWPDAEQQQNGHPLVPMLSRWSMSEEQSGHRDMLQVQYAFLELPKLPKRKPTGPGAELWAWLFVYAPTLEAIPPELSEGPYREALELANKATFTRTEMEAYHKVVDEIQQVRDLASAKYVEGLNEGFTKGEASGFTKGEASGFSKGEASGVAKGKAAAIFAILAARGLSVTAEARTRIEECKDEVMLDRWIAQAMTAASSDEM
jgi:predicted transposase/invertase (TIGR01784 family)